MNFAQEQSRLEERVAQRYRDEGYEVVVNPKAAMIPFDIGRYRPDLLALKTGLSLIIEVKSTSRADVSYERLRPVIEEVRRHDGWRFVLVTERDFNEVDLKDEPEGSSWEQIRSGQENARRLQALGEQQAAYLMLWIAFEQTIRKLSIDAGLPLERLAPSVMVRQLYSEGVLSMEQFDVARSCLETRNLIVHGFQETRLGQQFQSLESILTQIVAQQS